MQTRESESSLVERAAAGDAAGMAGLLDRHRDALLVYARRHLPDDLRRHVEPGDVVQDTFFEAFRRLHQFTAPDADAAYRWLVTIARNRIINLIKRHRAAKRGGGAVPSDPAGRAAADGSLEDLLAQLAIYTRTPSRSAIAHELAAALERAIAALPADYARAIWVRYVACEPMAAVATTLGRTERAAQMVCNRALKALRDELRSASRYE